MNNFYTIDTKNKNWNEYLKFFDDNTNDIFYSREFASISQSTIYKDHKVLCLIAHSGNDVIICPVVKREFKYLNSSFNDLTSLYSNSGPLINNKDNYNLKKFFEKNLNLFCKKEKIINYLIRYNPLLYGNSIFPKNAEIYETGEFVYVNLKRLIKPLMKNFSYRHIKSIQKAINNNIKILISNEKSYISNFCELYYREMDLKNAEKFYFFDKDFFLNLKKKSIDHQFFFAIYEDKIISCELVLYGKKFCHSYLGATDIKYRNLCPNHLIKFKIIEHFCNLENNYYMVGGGDEGILNYKKGFSNEKIITNKIGIINYNKEFNINIKKYFRKKYGLTKINKIQFYENYL